MHTQFKVPAILATFFTIWAIGISHFGSWAMDNPSIYDTLKSHGLPMGLLPKGVKEYRLNDDGRFEAFLEQPCNAKFESELHYDQNVSGQLVIGQIRNLTGVSAQDLFLWFPVKGIRVDIPSSGVIYFDVGVVHKQFSASLFDTPRDCVASPHPTAAVNGVIKKLSGILRYAFNLGQDAKKLDM